MNSFREQVQVVPKTARFVHKGHSIVLSFRPNAMVHERWSWLVKFTRTYEFVGACGDEAKALREAKKAIDKMEARSDG